MVNFYWYPKCSTCQKAKRWLDENKVEYNLIDMIAVPPSADQLSTWMEASDLSIRRFFNYSGARYRAQNLKDIVNDFSIEEAASRLTKDGMLIKRPILEKGTEPVVVGFKESAYADLLN